AHVLNLVVDRGLESHDAPRIHANQFARSQSPLQQGAAGVDKGPPVAQQALHDEALASEQADAELALECNADADALRRREKRVLLRDEFPADVGEMNGNDLSGIGRA